MKKAVVFMLATLFGCRGTVKMDPAPSERSVYELTVKNIDGEMVDLGAYRGKVTLFVNVASRCGFTPQYEGLEALYRSHGSKGFSILGFPSNDFGGQEPGSDTEIKSFCNTKYNVSFPIFSKVKTDGDDRSPVYQRLGEHLGAPKWNFYKYLVDKKGRVRQVFSAQIKPEASELRDAIEKLLAEPG